MKKTLASVTLLAAGAGALAVQETEPQPAPRLEQHQWLQQLVGEWSVTAESETEPGTQPMRVESTEVVRSIGGLWVVGEGTATFGGTPFTSIMTLGYDSAREAFVGTWIDTMQTHMWSYLGTLDGAKKVLTLATEGPSFDDPSRTAKYRDAIEIKSRDHRVLTSSIQNDDGTWTTFMRADYRRRRK